MNLDLDQVHAFVAAADELHFGRAAQQLHLSQQGLSRRISRLERALGADLFVRLPVSIELADAGRRFLPHARNLLALAHTAADAVHPTAPAPLRIDVWGTVQHPQRLLRRLAQAASPMPFEISMRRSTDAAIGALRRGEIDAAFGCVRTGDLLSYDDIACELAGFDRLVAAVPVGHELAGRREISTAELARHGLWWPVADGPELQRWVASYASEHGIPLDTDGASLGAEYVLDPLVCRGDRVTVFGQDWSPTGAPGVRLVPIGEPAPYLPWSLLWLRSSSHPVLPRLRDAMADLRATGWVLSDAGSSWKTAA